MVNCPRALCHFPPCRRLARSLWVGPDRLPDATLTAAAIEGMSVVSAACCIAQRGPVRRGAPVSQRQQPPHVGGVSVLPHRSGTPVPLPPGRPDRPECSRLPAAVRRERRSAATARTTVLALARGSPPLKVTADDRPTGCRRSVLQPSFIRARRREGCRPPVALPRRCRAWTVGCRGAGRGRRTDGRCRLSPEQSAAVLRKRCLGSLFDFPSLPIRLDGVIWQSNGELPVDVDYLAGVDRDMNRAGLRLLGWTLAGRWPE